VSNKVVVTDYTFANLDIETAILEPLGCDIIAWLQAGNPTELARGVVDADHVLTQFARIDASVIAAMTRAKVIVRYGVGVDNVDLDAARIKSIPVCNVPDYCMDEVADHAVALILATTRQIAFHSNQIHVGKWGLAVPAIAMKRLGDLTIGVVGFGRIGREVVRRLKGFGCRLLVHDPVVSESTIREGGCKPVGFEVLLRQSDLITLHCPSTTQTRRMIRREAFARMKPGAILINVSRGDLVDSVALAEAMANNRLAGVGLDVFDPEPIPADSPLLRLPNVVITPHIASVSEKAVVTLRTTAAGIIAKSVRGEPLPNVVNGVEHGGRL